MTQAGAASVTLMAAPPSGLAAVKGLVIGSMSQRLFNARATGEISISIDGTATATAVVSDTLMAGVSGTIEDADGLAMILCL